jgi:hypothetical protein
VDCEPRIRVVPEQVRSAGPQIVRLAAMAGIKLDEAQQLVANATGVSAPMAGGRRSSASSSRRGRI